MIYLGKSVIPLKKLGRDCFRYENVPRGFFISAYIPVSPRKFTEEHFTCNGRKVVVLCSFPGILRACVCGDFYNYDGLGLLEEILGVDFGKILSWSREIAFQEEDIDRVILRLKDECRHICHFLDEFDGSPVAEIELTEVSDEL